MKKYVVAALLSSCIIMILFSSSGVSAFDIVRVRWKTTAVRDLVWPARTAYTVAFLHNNRIGTSGARRFKVVETGTSSPQPHVPRAAVLSVYNECRNTVVIGRRRHAAEGCSAALFVFFFSFFYNLLLATPENNCRFIVLVSSLSQ